MKLDSHKLEATLALRWPSQNWHDSLDLSPVAPQWQTSTWVQLKAPPSPYSHDEALLLCQHSETEWVAWIPDYGEVIVHQNQFCQPS